MKVGCLKIPGQRLVHAQYQQAPYGEGHSTHGWQGVSELGNWERTIPGLQLQLPMPLQSQLPSQYTPRQVRSAPFLYRHTPIEPASLSFPEMDGSMPKITLQRRRRLRGVRTLTLGMLRTCLFLLAVRPLYRFNLAPSIPRHLLILMNSRQTFFWWTVTDDGNFFFVHMLLLQLYFTIFIINLRTSFVYTVLGWTFNPFKNLFSCRCSWNTG